MPLFGAHMSTSGGLHLAFERIASVQGQSLQIFTHNQRQWAVPEFSAREAMLFGQAWNSAGDNAGRMPVAAHASYLVNLASADPKISKQSVTSVAYELQRAQKLEISYVVLHPGAHGGQGVDVGLGRFIENLDEAFLISETDNVQILLENTAGQGTGLGATFEQLAQIVQESRFEARLGVCFDTCHAFGAGYDLRSRDTYEATFAEFDRLIGLNRLRFFHINDSKNPLGSHVDRHWHIGKGEIGLEAFRMLVNDPRFRIHPMVLETPKGKDLVEDKENLAVLRSLLVS